MKNRIELILQASLLAFLVISCQKNETVPTLSEPVPSNPTSQAPAHSPSSLHAKLEIKKAEYDKIPFEIKYEGVLPPQTSSYKNVTPLSDFFDSSHYHKAEKESGRAGTIEYLRIDDNSMIAKEYDDAGRLARHYSYRNDETNGTMVMDSYLHFFYDQAGNIVQIENRDKDQRLVPFCDCGYSVIKMKYDDKNKIIEEAAFNENGQPTGANGMGWPVKKQFTYDAEGDYLKQIKVFGRSGKSEYEAVFDKAGEIVSSTGEY